MVQSSSSDSLSVNVKKVFVTVIYECLCPHSQEFIKSQLLPTYKKLQDRLHVTLLPFGKARLNQNGTTTNGATTNGVICEHGDAECEGNKIQTCVAQVAKETLQAIEVVACMSNYKVPNSAAKKCVKASGVSWTMVHECVTKNGNHYVLQVAQETWKLQKNVTRVPLIAVNGENGPTSNGVICEHGSAECEGNKIQMCVAQVAKETLQTIEVVACMSSYKVPNKAAKKCVKASGVSWTMVHGCVTKNGNAYILKVAQETWKVQKNITRVPLIAVDGEVSSYIQEESQSSFLRLTCQKIGGVGTDQEPEPCAEERRRRRRR
ncbi:gamma-interferon inducible lysosomal thiol reductase, putative [Ixodes scapularis]|uniref:Gamma-interferon inducible lysosomal thiol reductase, putative n=1 Tax=Ixodes scapularis TaxID=6945 RepID=B7PM62_IXOSC|nr:gamma-interferon inducible lysosomal thiol reductase, putative [Ixodes scapularis]|eukprot:XP_002434860.1 gamma-interferon inducible lysosomal thiol reductase, putative [Ixodes scapularis]